MGPFPWAFFFVIARGLLATWVVTRAIPWLAQRGWAWFEGHGDGPRPHPQAPWAAPATSAPAVVPVASTPSTDTARFAPATLPPAHDPDPHAAGPCPVCGGPRRLRLADVGRWEAACPTCAGA